jgi:CRP-like cAMP-binding protein
MNGDTDLLTLLAPEHRRALLARCEHRVFQPGEVLIRQGSTPRSLFRVHSGFARVHREQCGARVELARLTPGAWFGEMSLIDGSPALATVTAEARIEVDQLSDAALERFLGEAPDTAIALYKALSRVLSLRLRTLTEALPERLFDEGPADVSLLKADGLVSYLTPTQFCDFEHPSIRALAAELAAGSTDPAEIARRAFYWVRDATSLGCSTMAGLGLGATSAAPGGGGS